MAFRSYIRVPRELFNAEEWTTPRRFSKTEAQIDLLQMAAYADGRTLRCAAGEVTLRRGQLLTSMRTLAARWGWSPAAVCRYLQTLRNKRINSIRIRIETAPEVGKTLLTICEYEEWEFEQRKDETPCGTRVETVCATLAETEEEIRDRNAGEECATAHTVVFQEGVAGGAAGQTGPQTRSNMQPGAARPQPPAAAQHPQAPEPLEDAAERDLLTWISSRFPRIQAMPEPFTRIQAGWMLRKYPTEEIRRLVAAMDNKQIYLRCRSAFSTFAAFAGRDTRLKEQCRARRLYTYEEMCGEIPTRARSEDFERVIANGRTMWRKKQIYQS